jgi:hypothetical protein
MQAEENIQLRPSALAETAAALNVHMLGNWSMLSAQQRANANMTRTCDQTQKHRNQEAAASLSSLSLH